MITVVIFKAFDKVCNECFIHGETWETINNKLTELCSTYDPLHILQSEESEVISLNVLNQFKTKEHV